MFHLVRTRALSLAAALALTMAIVVVGATAAAAVQAAAPAGGGLAGLIVRVDLAARTVDVGGAPVPIDLEPGQMPAEADVMTEVVSVGSGRHVVHVRVPAKGADDLAWEAILAAGRPPIFAGRTGLASGDPGERTGKAVQVRTVGASSYVLAGDVREDLGICGQRVTLLDPQALYPGSLELRPATVQRLSPESQAKALELGAVEKGDRPDAALAHLLVARGSSIAGDRGSALTDGDPATSWSEQRPGVGQGEFVVMAAPKEVPLARVQIAIAAAESTPSGAAPKTLYLVTDSRTFRVTLPGDGWVKSGRAFEVVFPEPIEASCLALVLDTAYTRGLAHPEVVVSELVAFSEFDAPGATLADVASKLSGPRAAAAAQVLERAGGRDALAAVTQAYDTLDLRGRALAMDIAASHDPCEEAVGLLARGLCESGGQAPRKAHEKLGRCRTAAPALAAELRQDATRRACLAPVLADLAPTEALGPLADAMGLASEDDRTTREALRSAFARALTSNAAGVLAPLVGDARLPPGARLEVMRAAGPRIAEARDASEATVAELLRGAPPMRDRYLVLEPLGELARSGDSAAAGRLAEAVAHDADWPVRARAAELAARLDVAQGALAAAARDPEPRVREAALGSLVPTPTPDGVRAASEVLASDAWSFVRAQAVAVLSAAGPSGAVDDALGGALGDASPRVRGGAVLALGRRRAGSWRDKVRERLGDAAEDGDVRAEAAWALGAMCDAGSTDRLTKMARNLSAADATDEARQLGLAALIALAALKPADLGDRLRPLLAKDAPADARHAAEKAVTARGTCR